MNKKIDNVLVTGGSGFLGINLIRYLFSKDVRHITILDLADFDYPEKDKVRFIKGDIRIEEKIKEAIKNADYVIHCAAALPLYNKQEIMTTEVEGTRKLLEKAYKQKIKRFVHISSTAVYGIPDHHPLKENDKLIGVGPYGEAKILAEKECEKFRKKGMIVSVIRPKSFIGPERLGVFALLYDWAKDGRNFPMIGSGKNRYQLLDVEDLCESIWLTLTLSKAKVNDTFNVGAKDFTTMKEDYQVVLDKAGFGKKVIGFPAKPMIWALRILEFFHLSPLYKWVYETACEDSFVSIEKAEKRLGYKPKYSNKDALLRNYKWYLDNLKNFSGKSGVSHRVPWKQGILGIVKWFF
jgi:nucleoside-diphosphate-sugar epimerase